MPSRKFAVSGERQFVFVSYAHDDARQVRPLLDLLKEAGVEAWYDEGVHPGSSWRDEIAQAIRECALFVYLITPASAASRNCQRECGYAVDLEKRILAVHLESAQLPDGLTLSLADRQAILAYRYARPEFERRFLESVKHLLGESEAQGRVPIPAPAPLGVRRLSAKLLNRLAWAALGLAAALGGAWLARRPDAPASPPAGRLELLVSTPETATFPTISRDGSLIAYVAGDGERVDLYVNTLGGGTPVRITDDAAKEASPRFSQDAREIVFERFEAEGRKPALMRVPALGGASRLVAKAARSAAWSSAGDALAYVSVDGPHSIRVVDLRTSAERDVFAVAAPYVHISSLDWAPGGERFVVVLSTGGISGDVWLVETDGAARRLVDEPANVFGHDAVFTDGGGAVIYSSNRAGAVNLWRQSLAGGAPEQLTRGPGPDHHPAVAEDGRIIFQSSRGRNELVLVESGGGERALFSHHAPIWAPAFSPDGRQLAFSRAETDGSWHIWLTDRAGVTRKLTDGDRPEIYPRFTSDGRGVLYFTWAPPFRVWLADLSGGKTRPVTPADWDAAYADAAPDGKRLAFARNVGGESLVIVAELNRIESTAADLGLGTLPRWSPDGEWIAFTLDRGHASGIHIVRPDGSGRRQLTDFGGWPTWLPDGRIGFTALGASSNQENFVVALDGSAPRRLTGPRYDGNNFPFDVSRNDGTIATSNARHLGDEIWLLAP